MEDYQVTSLEEVIRRTEPQIVKLSGWDEDEPFYARLQRIELDEQLMKISAFSNPLIGGRESSEVRNLSLKEIFEMMNEISKKALVEPDPEKTFPRLTIMQKMEIVNWEMGEVSRFKPFRGEQGSSNEGLSAMPDVESQTQSDTQMQNQL